MRVKVNIKVLFWLFIIYLFVFERALTSICVGFSYIDEVLAIITVVLIVVFSINRKRILSHNEWLILVGWAVVCLIGIIGNFSLSLLKQPMPIIIDIISMVKVWLAYYIVVLHTYSVKFYDQLIKKSAKIGRVLTMIMLLCLLLSQVINIGMMASARMGINSFKFVFNVPGNFSKLFYFLIPLLTADLYYKNNRYKKLMIGIALIVWASSMRSRAFAFIVVYIIMAAYFFWANRKSIGKGLKKKIRIQYMILFIFIAVTICWNQLVFYFTSITQARAVLLRYGIITMIKYFPIGAGFGTFGSNVAATYYSPLYTKYGFNAIYGMREGEEYFLNDNYWPMIMGQFGVIGTVVTLIIVIYFMKIVLQGMRENKYFYFATFCALGFLLLSSVASKSYSEYSSICVFMMLGVFVKREREVVFKSKVRKSNTQ